MAGNPAGKCDFDRSPENLKAKLNNTFQLRFNQLEAIIAINSGESVLVVGYNGAGESLCYQLPACFSAGVTVVISPFISLIKDQIQKLTELGIEAWTPPDDQGYINAESIYEQSLKIKLLYVTPEKMSRSPPLIEALQVLFANGLLARFVIDEAHCISKLGCDFRPEYEELNKLQQDFPRVPMIAVSVPIAPHIKQDILKRLQMTNPRVFTMSLNRTNLKYAVENTTLNGGTNCIKWIQDRHTRYPHDSGIVYCWKRHYCNDMAKTLKEAGLLACSYHGGMTNADKEGVQNMWKENKCQVICATFETDIHKPDVRYVIHSVLPKSMEQYRWETERACRNGNVSDCIIFYNRSDHSTLDYLIRKESQKMEWDNLDRVAQYCSNKKVCRRAQLLPYFGGVNTEANLCEENTEAICDNCESANKKKVMNVKEEGEGEMT
ncbi:unnamed protein product [Arctogadus glacialis]